MVQFHGLGFRGERKEQGIPLRPEQLFVGPTSQSEREWMRRALGELRGRYATYVEPCVGSFAMASAARLAGFSPSRMDTSDVTLFSSVMGYLYSGKPLGELEVQIDGRHLELDGSPETQAASILVQQQILRLEKQPDVAYWNEIKIALIEDQGKHIALLAKTLAKGQRAFEGVTYEAMDIHEHVGRYRDDENCVIYCAPPSYRGGYEAFYNTAERLTWAEPVFPMFDPDEGVHELLWEMSDAKALLIVLEERPTGQASDEDPLYARQMGPGRCTYILSNRPDEIRVVAGLSAVDRTGWKAEPLNVKIIPTDHEITEKSKIEVATLKAENTLYYRDLWMHKIDYKPAHNEFGVFIDGYLAGIAGYDTRAVNMTFAEKWRDALILTYAVGGPHDRFKLTKLVTALSLSKKVVHRTVPPWAAVQTEQVMTTAFTSLPESKGLRGIMKLEEKKTDSKYGYRLTYAAPLNDRRGNPKQIFQEWLRKERKRER